MNQFLKIFCIFLSLLSYQKNVFAHNEKSFTYYPLTNHLNFSGSISASKQSFCSGDSAFIYLSADNDVTRFEWYKDNVLLAESSTQLVVKDGGVYYVKLYNNAGASTTTNSVNISTSLPTVVPVIAAGGATTFCDGGSVSLTSNLTSNLTWQKDGINIIGANAAVYSATVGGSYRVKYSPSDGCTAYSNEIIITVPNASKFVITAATIPNVLCAERDSVLLSASQNVFWLKDGVALSNTAATSIKATQNGTYRAFIPNVNASVCSTYSNSIAITTFIPKLQSPIVTAQGLTTICQGSSVILNADSSRVKWQKDGVDISNTNNSASYAATQSGAYTAVLLTTNACNSNLTSNTITVIVNNVTKPTITASGLKTPLCAGVDSLILSASVGGVNWLKDGVPVATSTSNIIIKGNGSYVAVNTNAANGCSIQSDVFTVNQFLQSYTTPVVQALSATRFCKGLSVILQSSDSNIVWQKDGIALSGTSGYSYTATVSGIYNVLLKNTNACAASALSNSIQVIADTVITPIIQTNKSVALCKGDTLQLTSNVNNVVWQKNGLPVMNAALNTLSVTDSGTYRAVYTNTNGCIGYSNSIKVSLSSDAAPTIFAVGDTRFCKGGSVILSTVSTNVQWQKDGVDIAGQQFSGMIVTTSGNYNVRSTASGACAQIKSNIIAVNVINPPDTPRISTVADTVFCQGRSALLQASSSGVTWLKDGQAIAGSSGNAGYTATVSGTYQAIAYAASDSACSIKSNSIVIKSVVAKGAPAIVAAGNTSFCEGNAVALQANTTDRVQWQKNGIDISGANEIAFNATQTGIYRAYLPDVAVCGIQYSNEISVAVIASPAKPVITVMGKTDLCEGESVLLQSSVPGVQWFKNGTALVYADTLRVTQSGNYTAVNTALSCTSTANQVTINVNTKIVPTIFTADALSICNGSTITLNSNISNVQWAKDSVLIPSAYGSTFSVGYAGAFQAVSNNGGCIGYSNILRTTVFDAPIAPTIIALGNTSFCTGGSVLLSSSSSDVKWMKDGVLLSNATVATYNAIASGTYTAFTTNGTCRGTSNAITVSVNTVINPMITAATSTNICAGRTVLLTSNIAGVQWQKDNVNIDGATSQTLSAASGGIYTATFSNGACIGKSNALTVTVVALPAAPLLAANGATNICEGNTVVLTSNTTGVQWYKNDTLIIGYTAQFLNVNTSGRYKIATANANGCSAFSNEIVVAITPKQRITLSSSNGNAICQGSSLTLTSNVAGVSWFKNGTQVVGNGGASSYNVTETGYYKAALLNAACPSSSDSFLVQVYPLPVAPIISTTGNTALCEGGNVVLVSSQPGVQWFKNDTALAAEVNQTININKSGTYKAVIVGVGGCRGVSNEIVVTVNRPAVLTISAVGATTVCDGKAVLLQSNNPAVVWQKDGVTIDNSNGSQFAATATGQYRAAIADALCPSYSTPISIQILPLPAAPVLTASGQLAICDSTNITLTSSIAGVQWYRDTSVVAGGLQQSITTNQKGEYYAVFNNGVCTSVSNRLIVSAFVPVLKPTLSLADTVTSFCKGKSIVLYADTSRVLWTRNGNIVALSGASYTATEPGTYRLSWVQERCPVYSNTITLTQLPVPLTPLVTGTTTDSVLLCNGDSLKLTSNNSSVLWFKDGIYTTVTGSNYTAKQTGVYNAVAFSSNGKCYTFSRNIVVIAKTTAVRPVITMNNAPTTFCSDTGNLITSNLQAVIWQKNGSYIANTNYQKTYRAKESGTYRTVFFDTSGCVLYSNSFVLTALASPYQPVIARVTQPGLCDTGSIWLRSNINAGTIRWQRDSVDLPNSNAQSYLADSSGRYRMIISETGACNSTSNTLPITIQNVLLPVILWDGTQLSTYNNYTAYQWYYNNTAITGATTYFYRPTLVGKYRVDILTKVTCSLSSDTYNILVTSVDNNVITNGSISFSNYPNPASDLVNVQLTAQPLQAAQLTITTASGQVVLAKRVFSKNFQLSVSQLPNGVYTLQLHHAGTTTLRKLVVAH